MALSGAQVTVATSATALYPSDSTGTMLVRNRGSVAVYIGGSGVTTGAGFQLDPGESATMDLPRSGHGGAYGIVATGTARVDVLKVVY